MIGASTSGDDLGEGQTAGKILTALPVRHANQAVNLLRESAPGGFNGQEEEKDEGYSREDHQAS